MTRGQWLVGGEQSRQLHGLAALEVLWIALEVGLVDADPVNNLSAIARDDMKQVVHHFGRRAVLLYFQVESRVIHRHRLDLLTALTEPFEERTDSLGFRLNQQGVSSNGARGDDFVA